MTIEQAIELIAPCTLLPGTSQEWADLGCGNGLFSYALSSLLPKGGSIVCVDQSPQRIEPVYNDVSLSFQQADIQHVTFEPRSLSGILIANALHYVKDQGAFVERMNAFLVKPASWIIIEYDTDKDNPWVPYPLSFKTLKSLFSRYGEVRKLNERPSKFRRANLYACQVLVERE